MTTGRINQVARPPRQTSTSFRTRRWPGWQSLFRRDRFCKEKGAEAASSYIVSSIRDQMHKRHDLGGDNRFSWCHKVMPQSAIQPKCYTQGVGTTKATHIECNFP